MKGFSLKLGIVVAGFALATAPAFGQSRPSQDSGSGGAPDRSTGGGAASSGGAVDRGSASSGGGGGAVTSSNGGSVSSPGAVDSGRSPSATAVSSPSVSAGDRAVREFAPQHRAGFASDFAYEDGQKATPRSTGGGGGGGSAVTRGGGSSSGGSSSGGGSSVGSGPRSGSSGSAPDRSTGRVRGGPAPEASPTTNNANGAREVPSWSRPRGDRPTTGTAVDRTTPVPDRDSRNNRGRYDYGYGGAGYYYDPYGFYGSPYSNYYGYYPYGFGMGYGLYSGLGWAPYYGDPFGDPYGGGYGYGSGYSTSYGRGEQGNLKLKIKPRSAKVYVDGYFVGYVDQFDGSFQKLALNTGRHKVEVKADGFESAEFDVLINPEQTVTFQGDLKRIQ
jgi:PEGA domain-containing protein